MVILLQNLANIFLSDGFLYRGNIFQIATLIYTGLRSCKVFFGTPGISFHIILLSSCYLLPLSNQNQSVYLFLFHIPTNFMIKKTFLSGDLCALHNFMLWNISFPGWRFPAFYRFYQKHFSCWQPWWRPLVNTSLIS